MGRWGLPFLGIPCVLCLTLPSSVPGLDACPGGSSHPWNAPCWADPHLWVSLGGLPTALLGAGERLEKSPPLVVEVMISAVRHPFGILESPVVRPWNRGGVEGLPLAALALRLGPGRPQGPGEDVAPFRLAARLGDSQALQEGDRLLPHLEDVSHPLIRAVAASSRPAGMPSRCT